MPYIAFESSMKTNDTRNPATSRGLPPRFRFLRVVLSRPHRYRWYRGVTMGLSFGHLPASNHCLHCGACVEVCEHTTRKQEGPSPMAFRRLRRKGPEPSPADDEGREDPAMHSN